VHGVNDLRQTEIHTAEPVVRELSPFEIEVAIEKVKRHKSQGIDQIPVELIKADNLLNLLILFEIRKNCLRSERSR
jgi:hypothetical protein